MPSRLRRLAALGASGIVDLLRAQVALVRAQWRVSRSPIGTLVTRESMAPGVVRGDAARARALGDAVERAAMYGIFRPYCLVRTLALRDLLAGAGIEGSAIRVGVRQHRGKFLAHAWITWGSEVLGDRPDHVASFTEVRDINVLARP